MPIEPVVEESYKSPGFVAYVGHMGDQDRSQVICSPRYFTDETLVKGVFSIARDGGGKIY